MDIRNDMHSRAAKLGATVVRSEEVYGDGLQAPGFVVMLHRDPATVAHPFVTYFFNGQDHGFHQGHYIATRGEADIDFAARAKNYTRHHLVGNT